MLMKYLYWQFSIYINILYIEMNCWEEEGLLFKLKYFIERILEFLFQLYKCLKVFGDLFMNFYCYKFIKYI